MIIYLCSYELYVFLDSGNSLEVEIGKKLLRLNRSLEMSKFKALDSAQARRRNSETNIEIERKHSTESCIKCEPTHTSAYGFKSLFGEG